MKHIVHATNGSTYKAALLIKESSLDKHEIEKHYINPLDKIGYSPANIISFSLDYNDAGKAPAKLMQTCIDTTLKALDSLEVKTLLVADANYFKKLTKQTKADVHYGYILPCAIKGYEHMDVILSINYGSLFYNPSLQSKLDISLNTLVDTLTGIHIEPGSNIVHSMGIEKTHQYISLALEDLHKHPVLTVDVETFSLELHKSMLGTIAFAWDQHNGVAIDVGMAGYSPTIISLLQDFFVRYTGKCIYHGATFDIKVLIFVLFMKNWSDTQGMVYGLNLMTRDIECTKLITFLATNSTSGNKLDLKSNAQEFAGNYAVEDIDDITLIPLKDLYRYNLIDCLCTWYVYNKNYPIMVADDQETTYRTITQPSIKVVVQMELTGMPLHMPSVFKAKVELSNILCTAENVLKNSDILTNYYKYARMRALIIKNASFKKKVISWDDFKFENFNPHSTKQVSDLLHNYLKLPIIDKTPTKQAAVGAKSLKKQLNLLKSEFNITDEELN